ncbi:hypothetical protein LCGC14_0900010 [marine sediment metagenome]|uniref:Uncharacterized protein n=1 Tax=marine sediment metagenome TaxID=412755 RepID=A0A0F9S3L1_9ZZZZ|nr:hypothetical protein [bacterium]
MVQIIKKQDLKYIAKQDKEKTFVVIPEFGIKIEKKDKEEKIKKKSRLFKKQTKKISIEKVKSTLDTKIYNNRLFMR